MPKKSYEPWLVYNTPFGKRYFSLPRLWARRWFKILVLVLVVGSPFLVRYGWPVIRPVYHEFRAEQYDARARKFLAEGDGASAAIMVENALRHDSNSADRMRLYAEALQMAGRPTTPVVFAMAWDKNQNDEKLAVETMQVVAAFRSFEVGGWVLPRALAKFPKNAELLFHGSALLALQNDLTRAAALLRAAMELDKDNKDYKFAFCSLQLASGDPAAAKLAEETLGELVKDPNYKARGLTLLATYRAAGDPAAGVKLWDQVLGLEPENFNAKLSKLTSQGRADNSVGAAQFKELRARATNVVQKVKLIESAFSLLGPTGARPLLDVFSDEDKRLVVVMVVLCSVSAAEERWADVLNVVSSSEGVPMEAQDRLTLSLWKLRAEATLGNDSKALATRHEALAYVGRDAERAVKSGQTLEQWGFVPEAAEFYEHAALIEGPFQLQALNHLLRVSTQIRDARRNLVAAEGLAKQFPNEPLYGNNLANILLVLNTDIPRAADLAVKAHQAHPDLIPVTDTYARALTLQGKVDEAVKLYAAMDESALSDGGIRLNYADALYRLGRKDEAAKLVEPVNQSAVYPEQVRLLEDIRGGARRL